MEESEEWWSRVVGFGFTVVFDRGEERWTNKGQNWQVGKSEDAGSGSSSWREREKHHLQETKTAAAANSHSLEMFKRY